MKKKATEEAIKALKKGTAYELVNRSGLDPCLPVSVNSKLNEIITKLCIIHRVPVLEHDGSLISTVSQSSVLKFIYNNWSSLENEYKGKTISDIGLGKKKTIIGVNANHHVLHAISLCEEKEVSALPVLDENGKVIANFSASDLRQFIAEDWMNFSLSVEDYIKKYSTFSTFTIKPTELFSNVVKYFSEGVNDKKYHRFWVVDDEGKPISTVTMTDIMRYISDLPVETE